MFDVSVAAVMCGPRKEALRAVGNRALASVLGDGSRKEAEIALQAVALNTNPVHDVVILAVREKFGLGTRTTVASARDADLD